MTARRCAGVIAALLAAVALRAAEPAHDQGAHDHGADAAPAGGSSYSAADLRFLTHMIVHHQQALELCDLVAGRSTRPELLRYARYLDDAQRTEIDHMRGLLQQAAERGVRIPDTHLQGDPPMAGMLSRAQMKAIAAATGAAFERLWLEGMIVHHEGALEMAIAQQQAQFRSGHRPWGVDTLVDEMLTVQRGEITKMRAWLKDWR